MGNAISPSCLSIPGSRVKLFFYDGTIRTFHGKRLAAEIIFEFPDCMVCHADSFYIGQPIPTLAFDTQLVNGETYVVLPLDSFPCGSILSASSLAALGSCSKRALDNFTNHCPFEYLKGSDGRISIKVKPEFIIKLITRGKETEESTSPQNNILCSTPELKKHYDHLVGSKEQVWSPKLETISECRGRNSPWRCIGLEHERRGEVEG